jgi:hypothetical protein
MSDSPTQKTPQDDSHAQNKKSKGKNIKDTEKKLELGKRSISAAFGTLITIIAFCLHGVIFWFFIIPGLLCLSYCLRLELKHHGYKRKAACNWGLILFSFGLIGSLAYKFGEVQPAPVPPTPKPHLSLLLTTSVSPKDVLWITNNDLISGPLALSEKSDGFLLIPVFGIETNIVLQFMFANDSEIPIEDPQVVFIIPDSMTGLIDPASFGWDKNDLFKQNGTTEFSCQVGSIILPDSAKYLPELHFDSALVRGGQISFVSVGLEGKNFPKSMVSFFLTFIPRESAGFSEPHINFRMNAVFETNFLGEVSMGWTGSTFRITNIFRNSN